MTLIHYPTGGGAVESLSVLLKEKRPDPEGSGRLLQEAEVSHRQVEERSGLLVFPEVNLGCVVRVEGEGEVVS
tara:strand:- start:236 stop:454 length:219 start_codon:yes stop_codon:yes gene_type:complete